MAEEISYYTSTYTGQDIDSAIQKIPKLQDQINTISNTTITSLSDSIKTNKTNISTVQKTADAADTLSKANQTNLTTFNNNFQNLKASVNVLEDFCGDERKKAGGLTKLLSSKVNLTDYNTRIEDIEERQQAVENNYNTFTGNIKNNFEIRINNNETNIKDLTKTIKSFIDGTESNSFPSVISLIDSEKAERKKENEGLESRIKDIEVSLSDQEATLNTLSTTVGGLESIYIKKDEIDSINTTLTSLQDSITSIQQRLAALEGSQPGQ